MRDDDGLGRVAATAWGACGFLFLFSCVINMLMLTGPLFMLQIYDRVLASGSLPTLVGLTVLVAILFGFLAIFEVVRTRILARVGERVDEVLQEGTFASILRQGWFAPQGAAAHSTRDLDTVRSYLATSGPAAFFDLPWVPAYLVAIYAFHPVMGQFALGASAVLIALAVVTELTTGGRQFAAVGAQEEAQRYADEVRRQAEVVTALGMTTSLNAGWAGRKAKALRLHAATTNRMATLSAASRTLRLFFQSGILAVGAWLAISQQVTPGVMIAGSIIMARALSPVEQLIAQWRTMTNAHRAWQRIKQLLREPPAFGLLPMELPRPRGRLSVKGLSCYLPGQTHPLVSRIEFELEPGAGLGIIGPSGSGKTTLTKALMGLWPRTQGEVRFDGATFEQWERDRIGKFIGYLPQDVVLLPGSVGQNISRFEPAARPDKIVAAAQLAGVHELVLSFADGYDTQVGPAGQQLSAGQRQRVALARAVYDQPSLVILDEPNSNLDATGDLALHHAILALREAGTTVIVVAHRPSAVNALGQLLYITGGEQVTFGPKEEVLRTATRVAPVMQPVAGERGVVPAQSGQVS